MINRYINALKNINYFFVCLIILMSQLVACNDNSNDKPIAVLNVRETGNMPAMLAIDATDSTPGESNAFTAFTISIKDNDSDALLKQIIIEDNFDNSIKHVLPIENTSLVKPLDDTLKRKNIKGDYLITLMVATTNGLIDSTETVINIGDVWLNHVASEEREADITNCSDSEIHCSFGDNDSDSDSNVLSTCYMSDSCKVVDLTDVLSNAQDSNPDANLTIHSPLAIGLYGAVGAAGCKNTNVNGDGGDGGFTQIFTTINTYQFKNSYEDNPYNLSFYLGDTGSCRGYKALSHDASGGDGGSSSLMSFTSGNTEQTSFLKEEILAVAGGGGGGGGGGTLTNIVHAPGGDGSRNLYRAESEFTVEDGGDCYYEGDTCGDGGIGDLDNIGGYGGYGYSGDGTPMWLNGTPPVSDYGAGENADYDSDTGGINNPGAGGGGAGGGGAGYKESFYYDAIVKITYHGGGGGGASLVSPSDLFFTAFSPDGRESQRTTGELYFYFFDTPETECELDDKRVVCTITGASFEGVYALSLDYIIAKAMSVSSDFAIDKDTTMWLQAYGSASGQSVHQAYFEDTDTIGQGGFAQTVTSYNDLSLNEQSQNNTLFVYFAEQPDNTLMNTAEGGSATIVSFSDALDSDTVSDNVEQLIVLAGGGGGAASSGGEDNAYKIDSGNRGGIAIASLDENVYGIGSGDAGGGPCSDTDNSPCGGDYTNANSGQDGVGGLGGVDGDQIAEWANVTPNLVDTDMGRGGNIDSGKECDNGPPYYLGAGGGGYGGGASGYCLNASGHAGSGGGSYALLSTQTDDDAPSSTDTSTIPDYTGDGKVVIVFNPNN